MFRRQKPCHKKLRDDRIAPELTPSTAKSVSNFVRHFLISIRLSSGLLQFWWIITASPLTSLKNVWRCLTFKLWEFHGGLKQSSMEDWLLQPLARIELRIPTTKSVNWHLTFLFWKLDFLTYFFLERKNGIRDSDEKSAGCGILVRSRGMRDQDHSSRLSQHVPHKTRPYTIDGKITLN